MFLIKDLRRDAAISLKSRTGSSTVAGLHRGKRDFSTGPDSGTPAAAGGNTEPVLP